MKILQVSAQELLDSRGNPTVEATVYLDNHMKASGMVPPPLPKRSAGPPRSSTASMP